MFDLSGLKTEIRESAHESSEMIIGRINSRLHGFVKSDELQDDATIVAFKVKGKRNSSMTNEVSYGPHLSWSITSASVLTARSMVSSSDMV
jgi:hypothetical protein